MHAGQCCIEVKDVEKRTGCTEILRVIHAVVYLPLHFIQVRDCPFDLETMRFPLFVLCVLQNFLRQINSLNVFFEDTKGLAMVENILPVIDLCVNFVFLWRIGHQRN